MDLMNSSNNTNAELVLFERKLLKLRGVEDVVSFDDLSVYLITKDGNLLIEGLELHITALDVSSGNVTIEGLIRSMIYDEKDGPIKNGFFSRIFK